MPWEGVTVSEQRRNFIRDYTDGSYSKTELAERFSISRKTAYKWIGRFQVEGLKGLEERSRRPRSCPWQTDGRIVEDLVQLRKRFPSKGPKKLLDRLQKSHRFVELPAQSTVAHILDCHGLVKRKRRHRSAHPGCPKHAATAPNDIWAADYKGQFRLKNRQYCFPLTVSDLYSRFLLECEGHPAVSMELTIACFLRLFREYGLPNRIRTDNGVPFASCALARLSQLQVLFIKYGIYPELIEPGKPQQNGIHERMHRTLKQEATIPPGSSLKGQQRKFDAFRQDFNTDRPHEALGMAGTSHRVPTCCAPDAAAGRRLRLPRALPGAACQSMRHHSRFSQPGLCQPDAERGLCRTAGGGRRGLRPILLFLPDWALRSAHQQDCRYHLPGPDEPDSCGLGFSSGVTYVPRIKCYPCLWTVHGAALNISLQLTP